MDVFCVDDNELHLEKIQKAVEKACEMKKISDCNIILCKDGQELLTKSSGKSPQLVTLDINMPNVDGLSALIRFKKAVPGSSVIMVSSENEAVVTRLTGKHNTNLDPQKKEALLTNVINRVRSGIVEPGKINSVLEAVSNLGMDPLKVALSNGAREILIKPYDMDAAAQTVSKYL